MKKILIAILIAISLLFFCAIGFIIYLSVDLNKPIYCALNIWEYKILEIDQKKHLLIKLNTASIEKAFPNSYLLITEKIMNDPDNDSKKINFSIVARYKCISHKLIAIPIPAIILSEDFFPVGKTIITTGKPGTHLFTINKTPNTFEIIDE